MSETETSPGSEAEEPSVLYLAERMFQQAEPMGLHLGMTLAQVARAYQLTTKRLEEQLSE